MRRRRATACDSSDTWWMGVRLVVANGPNIFQMLLVFFKRSLRRSNIPVWTFAAVRSYAFHWTAKIGVNSTDLNVVDYSAWKRRCNGWCIVTKFQTLTRANRQPDSAEPEHVEPKKTDDGYHGEGFPCPAPQIRSTILALYKFGCTYVCMLKLVWSNSVCRWSLLLLSRYVRVETWVKFTCFCRIRYKRGKEYLNAITCKFYTYSRKNFESFDISHAFLPLTIAKLSTLKKVWFFSPTPYTVFKNKYPVRFLIGSYSEVWNFTG